MEEDNLQIEIKDIIFDMGNVLIVYDPEHMAENIFKGRKDAHDIAKAITESEEWELLDEGMITEEQAVKNLKGKYSEYEKEIPIYMENWQNWIRLVPGMYELIVLLKDKGYGVHLLSNASIRYSEYAKLYKVFDLMDSINVSGFMKMRKPNIKIYETMLEKNKLTAENCLFIDDMNENLIGAKKAGINTYQFTSVNKLIEFLRNQSVI